MIESGSLNNIGLELLCDNRSGNRLELVLQVFNEESRINSLLSYYDEFDIVLLDGGSTDKTKELAINNGATIFNRTGPHVGESHFVLYLNGLSKSRLCFYMMADEFVSLEDLRSAEYFLQTDDSVVCVNKIEWMYCNRRLPSSRRSKLALVRGFRAGSGVYDPSSFHDSLKYSQGKHYRHIVIDLNHLHIKSVADEYGKVGRYLVIELDCFTKSGAGLLALGKRYLKPVVAIVFWRAWRLDASLANKLFYILEHIVSGLLAIMVWLEVRYFPNSSRQIEIYSRFYTKHNDPAPRK